MAFTLYFNIIFLMKSEPFPGRGVGVGDGGAAPTALNPRLSRKNMRQRQWLKNSKMISNYKFKKPYESQM